MPNLDIAGYGGSYFDAALDMHPGMTEPDEATLAAMKAIKANLAERIRT